jgi:hypothetical protein
MTEGPGAKGAPHPFTDESALEDKRCCLVSGQGPGVLSICLIVR